jgi:hypothetical protein
MRPGKRQGSRTARFPGGRNRRASYRRCGVPAVVNRKPAMIDPARILLATQYPTRVPPDFSPPARRRGSGGSPVAPLRRCRRPRAIFDTPGEISRAWILCEP